MSVPVLLMCLITAFPTIMGSQPACEARLADGTCLASAPAAKKPPDSSFVTFVNELEKTFDSKHDLDRIEKLMAALVAHDSWLPAPWARSDKREPQQHLLYYDPDKRFSVISYVWHAGQTTRLRDHRTWAVLGQLRGSESEQLWRWDDSHEALEDGDNLELIPNGGAMVRDPGAVHAFASHVIHNTTNVGDGVAVSIHVYGGDIGNKKQYLWPLDGRMPDRNYVSGYANRVPLIMKKETAGLPLEPLASSRPTAAPKTAPKTKDFA